MAAKPEPLILASASTARARMLEAAGIAFTIEPAAIDEARIKAAAREAGHTAIACALALATEKARAVSQRHPDSLVIGADQILVAASEWFDKPSDLAEARAQLQALRGRGHALATALCIMRGGTMGWLVAHSRSPALHNFWIEEHGIDGAYVPLPVRSELLAEALRALPILGFRGCNLTLPHKQAALSIVDRVEPLARRIGAMNTVIVAADGSLEGRNTDVFGFRENLRGRAPEWAPAAGPAVVLGAGGAAR